MAIFRGKGGQVNNKVDKLRINHFIKIPEVRLIDNNGQQVGIIATRDALKKAEEAGLDLVEVSPLAKPPVCKIIDYGKFQYEASKKSHVLKAAQKTGSLKEVKFRPFTDTNDRQIKLKKLLKFLGSGHKVKVVITYRGRERAYQRKGLELLREMYESVAEHAIYDLNPKMEGSTVVMILSHKSIK